MQQLLPNGHLKAAQQRSTGRLRANKEPSCSFGQLHLGSLLDHGIHSCLRALLTATRYSRNPIPDCEPSHLCKCIMSRSLARFHGIIPASRPHSSGSGLEYVSPPGFVAILTLLLISAFPRNVARSRARAATAPSIASSSLFSPC
ncbi:hypothetical protein PMIN07_011217 [Paraphaeosphaeria minitans]